MIFAGLDNINALAFWGNEVVLNDGRIHSARAGGGEDGPQSEE